MGFDCLCFYFLKTPNELDLFLKNMPSFYVRNLFEYINLTNQMNWRTTKNLILTPTKAGILTS